MQVPRKNKTARAAKRTSSSLTKYFKYFHPHEICALDWRCTQVQSLPKVCLLRDYGPTNKNRYTRAIHPASVADTSQQRFCASFPGYYYRPHCRGWSFAFAGLLTADDSRRYFSRGMAPASSSTAPQYIKVSPK